jgi:type IX secretion system PorP/SprF family membrane protein
MAVLIQVQLQLFVKNNYKQEKMNSMKYFALLILGLFACSFWAEAQQLTNFNLYSQNKYTLNPANAGDQEYGVLFFNDRRQWVSLQGAPKTTMFGMHGSVNEKIGLGAYFYSDQTDLLKRNAFALSYSYQIQLYTDHFLTFGVSAGAIDQHIDYDRAIVEDPNDAVLLSSVGDGYCFDAGFGLRYTWEELEVGIAVPQLLETSIRHQSNYGNYFFSLERHYLIFASYNFYIEEHDIRLTPHTYFRSSEVGPTQLDVGVVGEWNKLAWLGVAYRQGGEYSFSLKNSGLVLTGGMNLYEKVDFGYSYEIYGHPLNKKSSGTHEVFLAYRITKQQANVEEMEFLLNNQIKLLRKIDSLQREIDKLRFDLNKLTDEYKEDKEYKESQIEDLKYKVDSLTNLLDIKDIQLTEEQLEKQRQADENRKALNDKVNELNKKIKLLNDKIFSLSNDRQITALEENNAQLINSADILKDESNNITDIRRSDKEIEDKLKDLTVVEYNIDKVDHDLNNLKRAPANEIIQNFTKDNIVEVDRNTGNESEMDKGYYVVVMAFRNYEYAVSYYDNLQSQGIDATIAHNKTRGFYYIYVNDLKDEEKAIEKRETQKDKYKGIWIYEY